jgi:hypothetical protein
MVPDHVYAELQSDHDEALLRIGDLERALHEVLSTDPESKTAWTRVWGICRAALDA